MSEPNNCAVWSIIVGGGSGSRYGAAKQFADLGGRRVIDWAVRAASAISQGVVVVVPEAAVSHERGRPGVTEVVAGGPSRSSSVRQGLACVPDSAKVVLVHDAARPLASAELFSRTAAEVIDGADAVVPTIPVVDSLRRVGGGPVDRSDLAIVQTPQGFNPDALRQAHQNAPEASDDAGLIDALGGTVSIIDGETTNIKITASTDIVVAEALLAVVRPG